MRSERAWMNPGGTSDTSGAMDKIATFHAAPPCSGVSERGLRLNGRAKRAPGYQAHS
jgi:hypothetical protein